MGLIFEKGVPAAVALGGEVDATIIFCMLLLFPLVDEVPWLVIFILRFACWKGEFVDYYYFMRLESSSRFCWKL